MMSNNILKPEIDTSKDIKADERRRCEDEWGHKNEPREPVTMSMDFGEWLDLNTAKTEYEEALTEIVSFKLADPDGNGEALWMQVVAENALMLVKKLTAKAEGRTP